MEAQFEALSALAKSGETLTFGQEFFVKFYQAFLYNDRWLQYIEGVGTTLLVTAIALVLGVVLGSVVALVRVGHDQQKPHHRNPVLGFINLICQIYATVIRGTPMMVQLLIMSMVIFASSRNFTMVGALALGINSGAYVSEIIRGGFGGKELLYAAQGVMNRTYEAMFPLLGVAAIYLVLVLLFSTLLGKLERRMAQSDRR